MLRSKKGYITCKVCRSRIKVTMGNRRDVTDQNPGLLRAFNGIKEFEAFNCDVCGCQNVVGERLPDIKEVCVNEST